MRIWLRLAVLLLSFIPLSFAGQNPSRTTRTVNDDYYNRGVDLINAGRWNEAAADLKQAIRADPKDADAHFQLGSAYRGLKRYTDAVAEYKEALRLNPDDAEASLYLGWSENRLLQYAQAIEPLQKAAGSLPDNPQVEAELGDALLNTKQYAEAIAAYQLVVQLKQDEPMAYYVIGWCYSEMEKYAEAIEPFQQSIRLDPKFAPAPSDLGFAYRQQQRYPEGLAAYQQALAIDPKFAPAHHGLGVTYLALGNKAAAQEQLRILRGLDKEWADTLQQEVSTAKPSASAPGSSAATASDVIQTQDSNAPGVVGELTQCKRSEGVLSVKVRFHNTSGKAVEFYIYQGGNDSEREKAYITAASKKYFILKDSGGEYLTSPGEGGGLKVKLDPGQSFTWWAKFPAPAAEVKKINLMTPVTPPFEDVPITDK